MESEARTIHARAEEAREKEHFLDALKLTDEATIAYQKEGDMLGLSEVQSSRVLTLRHLAEQTGDGNYLVLAKYAALSSVEIAEKSGDKKALAIPYLNLGKVHESLGEIEQAVEAYKKAVENMKVNPPGQHNRSSVLQEMIIHLSVAEYKAGDKPALQRAEEALSALIASDEPNKYNKDVWVSGGYMGIAEILKDDSPEKAKQSLQKAKEIIDANPELTLRKKQFDKLSATF